MSWSLTEREREKVNSALKAGGFSNIEWENDTVRCDHRRNKSPCDVVRAAGFFVPCGGVSSRPYCQVWRKRRYFSKANRSNSADRRGGQKAMNPETTTSAPKVGSSAGFGWFWSTTHKEWNLRRRYNSQSRATVWGNGVWHTWDHQGVGGENSSAATVEEAKAEAYDSAKKQGFLDKPNDKIHP